MRLSVPRIYRLHLYESGVGSVESQKLVVGSALHYASLMDDAYLRGVLDCR